MPAATAYRSCGSISWHHRLVDPSGDGASTGESWRQRIAPLAAIAVLVGGVSFLVFRSGSGDDASPPASNGASVATAAEPGEPRVETTSPSNPTTPPPPTAPPLMETTTTTVDPPPTAASTSAVPTTVVDTTTLGPTQADVDEALLRLDDLDGVWTEEVVDVESVCGDNPELDNVTVQGAVLFQQLSASPVGVRQLGHTILSFPDDAAAERAFTADVELLEACSGTTVDLDGVSYRVEITSDTFDETQATAFPCADQNAFLIIQLTNDAATVPYIGQSGFSYRCGTNMSVTSVTTTLSIADLSQSSFFSAGATANTRASELPGSG